MTFAQQFKSIFAIRGEVNPRQYLRVGMSLMVLKYLAEVSLIYLTLDTFWTPFMFLLPSLALKRDVLENHDFIFVALVFGSLPFLWIGVVMSMRRLIDAGRSIWMTLFFMLPLINLIFMGVLCFLPSQPTRGGQRSPLSEDEDSASEIAYLQAEGALLGIIGAVLIAVFMAIICVFVFRDYGGTLFLGMPFFVSFYAGYHFNRVKARSVRASILTGIFPLILASATLFLFALEGVICIVMALPLAAVIGAVGAIVGRNFAINKHLSSAHVMLLVSCLPLCAAVENTQRQDHLTEVISSIEIDAPPSVVWRHVVSFEELPEPQRLLFKLGTAYPVRARIEGEGVGAIRYCEFSTGPFVEPITRWEAPHRLTFKVTENPPTMREWTLYPEIHAPHLTESFASQQGEFRLIELPEGRTRLEGSTWYMMKLAPAFYWRRWADAVIHIIHLRVLEHIKQLSERA